MEDRVRRFVSSLYFDLQTIDGVKPLEIWNGIRELGDPFELTLLVKNLYKIVIPLVNEELFDRPFEVQGRTVRNAVGALLDRYRKDPGSLVIDRFPDPPTGDPGQKELYLAVKAEALPLVLKAAEQVPPDATTRLYPDGLFNMHEMRVVDNELPYIIFTDKEFGVIHGLVVVYLWLIDLDSLFLRTLKKNGVGEEIMEEYKNFAHAVMKEKTIVIEGRKMEPLTLASRLREKLKYDDYHEVFEAVYRWFEATREHHGEG